jgi:hypothetical protein
MRVSRAPGPLALSAYAPLAIFMCLYFVVVPKIYLLGIFVKTRTKFVQTKFVQTNFAPDNFFLAFPRQPAIIKDMEA